MNYRYLAATLLPAILLIAPAVRAEEHSRPPEIVTRYCSGCHGIDGRSQLPYIPRLAGLNAAYIQRKLASFRAAASMPVDEAFNRILHAQNIGKPSGFTPVAADHMVGTAHSLSETERELAALWYATQQPGPVKSAKGPMIDEGKKLYFNGPQSKRVPACQSCHGPDAQGTDTTPRLAGQNAAYLLGQLALFRDDERQQSPMKEIARSLEDDQARALAAYLQSH